ncbi:MAG: heavy-metal-associated domain-containing protein [Sporolactobacillus sp.]
MITALIGLLLAVFGVFAARRSWKSMRSGCCGDGACGSARDVEPADRDLTHYPFKKLLSIEGMRCASCRMHVTNALNDIDGVYAAVDLRHKRAEVYMSQQVPVASLLAAVAKAGYKAAALDTVQQSNLIGG